MPSVKAVREAGVQACSPGDGEEDHDQDAGRDLSPLLSQDPQPSLLRRKGCQGQVVCRDECRMWTCQQKGGDLIDLAEVIAFEEHGAEQAEHDAGGSSKEREHQAGHPQGDDDPGQKDDRNVEKYSDQADVVELVDHVGTKSNLDGQAGRQHSRSEPVDIWEHDRHGQNGQKAHLKTGLKQDVGIMGHGRKAHRESSAAEIVPPESDLGIGMQKDHQNGPDN